MFPAAVHTFNSSFKNTSKYKSSTINFQFSYVNGKRKLKAGEVMHECYRKLPSTVAI